MCGWVVRLLAGAYALAFVTSLPPFFVLIVVFALGIAGAALSPSRAAITLLGLGWMGLAAALALSDRLDPELTGQTVSMRAEIAAFPRFDGTTLRFVATPVDRADLPKRIRLAWRDAQTHPQMGEHWRIDVRLRRPRAFLNPAGFDYEQWLMREGIGATGYVSAGKRLQENSDSLTTNARRRVVTRIETLLPDDDASAVLVALTVGARHRISRQLWDRFAVTGTSHLMAISGLHIGLAAATVFIVTRLFAAILLPRSNHRDVALIGALIAAFCYATLSGFGVPAQRACLMIALATFFLWRRHRPPASAILAASALAIFLASPLALFAPGFQLSFAAVAILIAASLHVTRVPDAGRFEFGVRAARATMRLGKLQLFLLFGLFPLTVLQFGRYSVLAPAINMLVLPLFGAGIVPLALAGALLDGWAMPVGDFMLSAAHYLLRLVLHVIDIAAGLPLPQQTAALTLPVTGVAFATLLYVCLPSGWPGRKLSLLALLFVVSWRPPVPATGCFAYTVLDVGQGLAIVVQTAGHSLLFDTGPAFPGSTSTAALVVEPFIRRRGIDRIDMLVISHADNDHAGGVASIADKFSPGHILSGEPGALPVTSNRCVAGQSWRWDDVDFEIIHPPPVSRWHGNNVSCMLRISAGRHRMLIAGDIESPVERLLAMRQAKLRADVVVVPHHGSATSSSRAFVERTGATTAIVSTAYSNRWGFPKPAVVERWMAAGTRVLNTATSGAISQQLCAGDGAGPLRRERVDARRFWHDSSQDVAGEPR